MNGVEYASKLNRQNEIYQKNLRDQRRANDERIDNLQKQTDKKIKDQSKAHVESKNKIEKDAAATIENYKTEQQRSLKDKSRAYELETEKLRNSHHDEQKKNLREWRGKFADLKETFDGSLKEKDKTNAETKEVLAKNYSENLDNIKAKSREEIDRYIDTTSKASDNTAATFVKDKKETKEANDKERNEMIRRHLREKKIVLERGQEDIREIRENQKNEFIRSRDEAKAHFKNMVQDQNNKREKFEAQRIDTQTAKNQEENRLKNEEFTDRMLKTKNDHSEALRNIETQKRIDKIANHAINRQIEADQKANEREQTRKQKQRIIDDKNDNITAYEDKIGTLTKKYQDTIQDLRLDFADKQVKRDKDITETFRQREVADRISDRNKEDQHNIALKYSEDRAKDRLDTLDNQSNTKIQNLKENFNKNMELANIKARKDFEKNREETVKEKAELQKRLHEQNSKTNTYLKKVLNEKMQKMASGYERRILELENQNKMIASTAQDAITNISTQSRDEINRQREIAKRTAKSEVEAERTNANAREMELRKTLNETQAKFERVMTEQAAQGRKRLKDTTRRLEAEKTQQARKYQDINEQNKKFFEREVARITASSEAEKEALVTQYEDRIQSLMKLQKQKIKEIQEFDKLNNQA